jgi:hypothetical protein
VTAAIVSLLATVIGFVVWLIKRRAANAELPGTVLKNYEDEARKAIAARDSAAVVNALLDDRLRAIGRNTRGQGNLLAGGGQDSSSQRLPSAESADAGDFGRVGKP